MSTCLVNSCQVKKRKPEKVDYFLCHNSCYQSVMKMMWGPLFSGHNWSNVVANILLHLQKSIKQSLRTRENISFWLPVNSKASSVNFFSSDSLEDGVFSRYFPLFVCIEWKIQYVIYFCESRHTHLSITHVWWNKTITLFF